MISTHWSQRRAKHKRNWFRALRTDTKIPSSLPVRVDELNRLLSDSAPEDVLKNDRTTTVACVTLGDRKVVLKRYNPRNQWHKVKRALRKSRARRCWDMSYVFQKAGLNVSPPLLMLEDRLGPFRRNAFFVNEKLQGKELLDELPKMSEPDRQKVKRAITEAFVKMKRARIVHGDMKATNLLWVNDELFFIDLDAAERHGPWSLTWTANHNKDKKRFVRNWEGSPEVAALFSNL